MIHIALSDETDTYSKSDLGDLAAVMNRYCADIGAAWGTRAVVHRTGRGPADAWPIRFLHETDEQDAVAYHEVDDSGLPAGRVFLDTVARLGISETASLAHEIAEMIVDPWCILAAQIGPGSWVGYEICDPIEADQFGYSIDGVLVSDFCYPGWFYPGLSSEVDHTGALADPLTLAPGGYASIEMAGEWRQVMARAQGLSRALTSHRIRRRTEMVELATLIGQDLRDVAWIDY